MLRPSFGSRFASVVVASALLFGCADDLVPTPLGLSAGTTTSGTATTSSTTSTSKGSGGDGGAVAAGGAGGVGAGTTGTGGIGGDGGAIAMGGFGGAGGTSAGGAGGGVVAAVVPDFSLLDDNANSATYGQAISPRDYLGQVSAWYFGHST